MEFSTQAVIIGLRKLQAYYNMPRVVTTDCGTNFVGSKGILDDLMKPASLHFEWRLVPTGTHNHVGTVERQVGMVKRIWNKKLTGATVTHNELLLLTAETVRILNSKLLTYVIAGADVNTWCIILPADLLGGRNNDGLCTFETKSPEDYNIWRS
jgi:hypothetical protein